ncbi:MAG TPA: hypothetical protein PL033_05885 [Candidatus Brocadiia bacterium]|nr:hypothetical protein [Candidatus Brocadiia bacterium]
MKSGEPAGAHISAAKCLTFSGVGLVVCLLGLADLDSASELLFRPTATAAVAVVVAFVIAAGAAEQRLIVVRLRLSALENLCRGCIFLGLAGAINAALLQGFAGLIEALLLLLALRSGRPGGKTGGRSGFWAALATAGILFALKLAMPQEIKLRFNVLPWPGRPLLYDVTAEAALCWAISIAGCGALIAEWRRELNAAALSLLEANLAALAAEGVWSASLQEWLGIERGVILGLELDEMRPIFRERTETRVQACLSDVVQLPRIASELPSVRGQLTTPRLEEASRALKELPGRDDKG